MSRAAAVRVLLPALLALALLAHHGGPPPPAAGHHGSDGCPACAHAPDGGLAAVCLGILVAALALPGLAAALRRRRPAPVVGVTPFARGRRARPPSGRAPPRRKGIADLCVLRR